MDEIILTDNGKRILKYMQDNEKENSVWVGKDLIELTNIKGVYPVLNSLIRNGLVEQDDPIKRDFTNIRGDTQLKEYKTYKLTNFGRMFEVQLDNIVLK